MNNDATQQNAESSTSSQITSEVIEEARQRLREQREALQDTEDEAVRSGFARNFATRLTIGEGESPVASNVEYTITMENGEQVPVVGWSEPRALNHDDWQQYSPAQFRTEHDGKQCYYFNNRYMLCEDYLSKYAHAIMSKLIKKIDTERDEEFVKEDIYDNDLILKNNGIYLTVTNIARNILIKYHVVEDTIAVFEKEDPQIVDNVLDNVYVNNYIVYPRLLTNSYFNGVEPRSDNEIEEYFDNLKGDDGYFDFEEDMLDFSSRPERRSLTHGSMGEAQKLVIGHILHKMSEYHAFSMINDKNCYMFYLRNKIFIKENYSRYAVTFDCDTEIVSHCYMSSDTYSEFIDEDRSRILFISNYHQTLWMAEYGAALAGNQGIISNDALAALDIINNHRISQSTFFETENERIMRENPEGSSVWCMAFFREHRKNESIVLLNYILDLMNETNQDYDVLNFKNMFFDENNNISVKENRRELNAKIFATRVPSDYLNYDPSTIKTDELNEQTIKAIAEVSLKANSEMIGKSKQDLKKEQLRFIRYKMLMKKSAENLKSLKLLNEDEFKQQYYDRSKIKDEIDSVIKSGLFEFVEYNNGYLVFKNIKSFVLRDNSFGRRKSADLGHFFIKVRLTDFKVKLEKIDENETPFYNYYHPYVPRDGFICFGAEETRRSDYYYRNQIYLLMMLVNDLLTSYDDTEPHCSSHIFFKGSELLKNANRIWAIKDVENRKEAIREFMDDREDCDLRRNKHCLVAISENRGVLIGKDALDYYDELYNDSDDEEANDYYGADDDGHEDEY